MILVAKLSIGILVLCMGLLACGIKTVNVASDATVSVVECAIELAAQQPTESPVVIEKDSIGIVQFAEQEKANRKRFAGRSWYDWAGTPTQPPETPLTEGEAAFLAKQRQRLAEELKRDAKRR